LHRFGPIAQLDTCLPSAGKSKAGREHRFSNNCSLFIFVSITIQIVLNMYIVYAIRSSKDHRIYVGFTSDLNRRLDEHNSGKTKSTKGFRPWTLIYSVEFENRIEARKRELYLKSGHGKIFLKNLVP
jgi:putative endonuclease